MINFEPINQEILKSQPPLGLWEVHARGFSPTLHQVTYCYKIRVPGGEIDKYDISMMVNSIEMLLKGKRFPADSIRFSVIAIRLHILVTLVYISN